MAVRHGRNEKKAFFCRNKAEGGDCDAPNTPYLETRLLDQVADFRWEEYFGDPKHDAERASAVAEVERLGQVVNAAQGVVDNLLKSIDDEVLAGRPDSLASCEPVSSCLAKRLLSTKQSFSTVSPEESWTTCAAAVMVLLLQRTPESASPTSRRQAEMTLNSVASSTCGCAMSRWWYWLTP